jgi:hypothetical protein
MYILPKLILLGKIMQLADIKKLMFVQTNGNCNALLTSPKYWEQNKSKSHHIHKPKIKDPLLTVNWHLEKDCNYKCSFCYAHFEHVRYNLDLNEGFELIRALK